MHPFATLRLLSSAARSAGARALAFTAVALAVLVSIAPGCGRASLEPEGLDAGRPSSCGPESCPNGCCDASGVCRTGRDVRACGSIGRACSDCVADGFAFCNADRVCGRDEPACGSATCGGCCVVEEGRLRCLSGTEPAACGQRGGSCVDCADEGRDCAETRACGAGKCDASNCAGCCVGDQCLLGNSVTACGRGGEQCEGCAAGQACRAESAGGGRCDGPARCGPDTCDGCCDGSGRCVSGTDTTACGSGGQACSACSFDRVCVPPGRPDARTCQPPAACGPSNCAGCCVGDQCVTSPTPAACGVGGEACVACSGAQICRGGECVEPTGPCSPANCDGCCLAGQCSTGVFDSACGRGGAACQDCLNAVPFRVCRANACVPGTCSPATCPSGCCDGNTCVTGTQDTLCGTGGVACTSCGGGQVCQGQQCRTPCGPGNCGGCCDASGICRTGNTTGNCGQGGVACANCAGSFCNGLVVPRRCSSQQDTCPTAYPSCRPSTALPLIPTTQRRCSNAELNALAFACVGGPETNACRLALAAVDNDCERCLEPFTFPYARERGIWSCAATENPACRAALGCALDCIETSCDPCTNATESACRSIVSGQGGQCSALRATAIGCAADEIGTGLCSQASYPSFGQWFRTVGDHFCGDTL